MNCLSTAAIVSSSASEGCQSHAVSCRPLKATKATCFSPVACNCSSTLETSAGISRPDLLYETHVGAFVVGVELLPSLPLFAGVERGRKIVVAQSNHDDLRLPRLVRHRRLLVEQHVGIGHG